MAAVSRTLTDNTAKLLRSGVTGTTSLGMVLYLSPKLSATALVCFPPMIFFGVVFGRTARRLSRELVDAYAGANQVASERIGAIRTVRLFGAEEYEMERYARRVDATFGLGRKVAIADGVFAGGMFYAAQMSLLGVLYVGGGMVMNPAADLSVGVLTSFSMFAVQLGVSVSSIGTAYGQLFKALGSGTRVFEVLDRVPKTQTSTLKYDAPPRDAGADDDTAVKVLSAADPEDRQAELSTAAPLLRRVLAPNLTQRLLLRMCTSATTPTRRFRLQTERSRRCCCGA